MAENTVRIPAQLPRVFQVGLVRHQDGNRTFHQPLLQLLHSNLSLDNKQIPSICYRLFLK